MTICKRCKKQTNITIMSMFNTDIICMDCKEKETKRPDYKLAREKELEEVRKGNYNYCGIGFKRSATW